ncbi:PadR family transcriptional regulator [Naumannella cuiyingiana]|uniref:DNA-binding PadR family transcriptional regulator n=1 Tax=Naumannella cuiyingiana TaxID=1347891 RepID=A0A7Z0DA58_9ACTN|nr:PadR family transcriptional regulator [Naumannella cuiyingiana]NYI71786.1 DNA-binding PadR family transcriptional regulator [Naumannella cuiyingiana]
MSLPHALLGVLSARPMNGYELTKFFDASTGYVWSAPQSQIYPTLRRMADDGWIAGTRQSRATALRSTVYSITEAGQAELLEWAGHYHPPGPARDAFFLQALYLDMVPTRRAREVLRRFIQHHERAIAEWESQRDALVARETPLLVERLRARPPRQHARIARLKASVFQGEIDRSEALIAWARAQLDLL